MTACFVTGGVTSVNGGRLSFVSNDPVPSSNVTAATTLYWTHFLSDQISLYNSSWQTVSSPEVSLSLGALSADTNYDAFGYLSSGSLALEALAWTNATTRSTALTRQDGVLAKSGDTTRRYLGTFRIGSAAGQSEFSTARRFLWNLQNREWFPVSRKDQAGTTSDYNSSSYRQANANSANMVEIVRGLDIGNIEITVVCACNSVGGATATHAAPGIGIDGTTDASTAVHAGGNLIAGSLYESTAHYVGLPGLGYRQILWLESSALNNTSANTRFYYNGYSPSGVHPVTIEPGLSGAVQG